MRLLIFGIFLCIAQTVLAQMLVIDRKGNQIELVESSKYDILSNQGNNYFSEGLLSVRDKYTGKFGYINHQGKLVIECKFYDAYPFHEGYAFVAVSPYQNNSSKKWPSKSDIRFGFIDKSGQVVIKNVCFGTTPFSEGLAFTEYYNGEKNVFIDYNGNIIMQINKNDIFPGDSKYCVFREGMLILRQYNTGTVIYNRKKEVIYSTPDDLYIPYGFSEGLAVHNDGPGKFVFIDNYGSKLMSYRKANNFSEGLAAVMIDNKWCYIDHSGNVVIKTEYDKVGDFHEGLAWVGQYNYDNGKYEIGFIDQNGILIVPFFEVKYDFFISDYHEGLCLIFNY